MVKKNKIIAVVGNHITTAYLISQLEDNGYRISYLIHVNKIQAGGVSDHYDLRNFARKHKIQIIRPATYGMKDERTKAIFSKYKIDLLISIGWQRLIPQWFLDQLAIGAFGMHGSSEFLPKGRGRSPMNWSLIEGKRKFIAHLFKYDAGIDSGDIVGYQIFDINPWDTIRTLHAKLQIVQVKLLLKHLPLLLYGRQKFKKQSRRVIPTYYPKRTPEDGAIDWTWKTIDIYNLVRAVTYPYPGAFTFWNKRKIMIWQVYPFDSSIQYLDKKRGEIVEVFEDLSYVVKTRDGSLLVVDYDKSFKAKIGIIFQSQKNNSFKKLESM